MLNVPEYLGHPLIVKNSLFAVSASDLLFHWEPGPKWAMTRVHHPLPDVDVEISPTARFGGYPPVHADDGVVVADETTNRFMALVTGQTEQAWHRDIVNSLGIPATGDHTLYTGFGGAGGVGGIAAIDSENGYAVWNYSPKPPAPDPQDFQRIISPKAVEVPVWGKSERGFVNARTGKRIDAIELQGYRTQMVTVPVMQPYATDPFQHWSNSGLVIAKEFVYGEVNHTIVALDREEGKPKWTVNLGPREVVSSIVATPEHLIFCVSTLRSGKREPVWAVRNKTTTSRLVALDLKDGTEVWSQEVPRPGNLALADGLLFFTDGALHVLGAANKEIAAATK